MSNSGKRKERRKHLRPLTPKIIGIYPKQVVAMRIPPNSDPEAVRSAQRKQHELAKSISSPYSY